MINNTNKVYKLKITTLSPIHIGDMVDFEPTGYVITDIDSAAPNTVKCPECGYDNLLDKLTDEHICGHCGGELEISPKKPYLYTFTPKQIAQALSKPERDKLCNVALGGDYFELEKFFKDYTSKIVVQATKHALVCPEIVAQYRQKYGNKEAQESGRNQFYIEKNIANPVTDLAYIPASSLKGAVRTALMSARNTILKLTYQDTFDDRGKHNTKIAEQRLYRYVRLTEDPFKHLKISDTMPQEAYLTEINISRNYSRKTTKQNNKIKTFMEIIPSGTVFEAELTLSQNPLAGGKGGLSDDITAIRKACNDFYGGILSDDCHDMTDAELISPQFVTEVQRAAHKPNAFLLRVGKHSGAQSITIENMRHIICNHGNWKECRTDKSTTFWLADNGTEKLPFGWCVVEFEEVR